MHPDFFGLPSYGVCFFVGAICGITAGRWLLARQGRDPHIAVHVALIITGLGMLGSRVLHVVEYWPQYRDGPFLDMIDVRKGGLSWYGVFVLLPPLLFYFYKQRLPIWHMADTFSYMFGLGQLFGRAGCYVQGCCYGPQVAPESIMGMRFPIWSPAWCDQVRAHTGAELVTADDFRGVAAELPVALQQASYPVIPTQLLLAGVGVLAGVVWLLLGRRRHREGQVFFVTISVLVVGRFFLEWVRGDDVGNAAGLTEAQWISAGLFVACIAGFVWRGIAGTARGSLLEPDAAADEAAKAGAASAAPQAVGT